jgi:hypothetical protein
MEPLFFRFESDFVQSLRCIPMVVRFKLDLCGIKLSLKAWSRFSHETRAALAANPTDTPKEIDAYGQMVVAAIREAELPVSMIAIDAAPAWLEKNAVHPAVETKVAELGLVAPSSSHWQALSDLQRYALIKLTRGGHENANFLPAMLEFDMAAAQ